MRNRNIRTLGMYITLCMLAPSILYAQIDRSILTHMQAEKALSPALTQVTASPAGGPASVEVKLPKQLSRYTILERKGDAVRPAANVESISGDRVKASLADRSTLMFVEKNSTASIRPDSPTLTRTIMSTYMLKSVPPLQPGGANRTASGTLTMITDMPTSWNSAGNAYIARLSVMFLPDNPDASALLPMSVEFTGEMVDEIQPRKVELQTAGVEGSQEVLATCNQYRQGVAVTAYYQTTNSKFDIILHPLSFWEMLLMIISLPMLVASLFGGFIGGLLRLFKGAHWKLKRVIRFLAEGVVVGLVTVTMLLAGLLQGQIAGLSTSPKLVLAFSLAAAAGSVGAHFLDVTVNRLRGKKSPAEASG